tara:strand:- start:496 stop:906 length:411 start_codon:yes stop_codon:yes gene_type:complete
MTSDYAAICLVCRDSVVLSKRISIFKGKPVNFGGYWSPFAGSIEVGETSKECVIRELKEESQFSIDPNKVFFQNLIKRKDNKYLSFFIGVVDEFPEIKLDYEHTECKIFKFNKLERIEPLDIEIFKSLKNYYENKI